MLQEPMLRIGMEAAIRVADRVADGVAIRVADGWADGAAIRVADRMADGAAIRVADRAADGAAIQVANRAADGVAGKAVTVGMASADGVGVYADSARDKQGLLVQGDGSEAGSPLDSATMQNAVSRTCREWQQHRWTDPSHGSIGCVQICTS